MDLNHQERKLRRIWTIPSAARGLSAHFTPEHPECRVEADLPGDMTRPMPIVARLCLCLWAVKQTAEAITGGHAELHFVDTHTGWAKLNSLDNFDDFRRVN